MEVILLKELRGRGGEGDVIDVSRGYANNYLLRQGYAVKATPGNLKQLEQRRANIEKREEVRVSNAKELAEKLEGLRVNVSVQVGEEGQLFGSVTAPMIADAIEALGIEIDRRRVELGKPIKTIGEFPVDVNIYRTIKATVTVVVAGEAKGGEKTDADATPAEQTELVSESEEVASSENEATDGADVVEAASEADVEEATEEVSEA